MTERDLAAEIRERCSASPAVARSTTTTTYIMASTDPQADRPIVRGIADVLSATDPR